MRHRVPAILMIVLLGALPALAQHSGHVVITPDAFKWVEPATLPGSRLAVVQGDPSKEGLFVYRLKLPAGGFVSLPPKHPHYAWASGQETVVQVHGVGPTDLTFVNPADDPRTKK